MASKGKSKVAIKEDGTEYILPSSQQTRYLITGLTMLRAIIGEAETLALARSNVDERRRLIRELMNDERPGVRDTLARVLTGLGLDPDELVKEATR